jgi:hypothetical protein
MKCEHTNFEMKFSKCLSEEYRGEAILLYKAICDDCGKRVKEQDEEVIFRSD